MNLFTMPKSKYNLVVKKLIKLVKIVLHQGVRLRKASFNPYMLAAALLFFEIVFC